MWGCEQLWQPFKGRRCGYCGKLRIPKLTVADGVIGKHRVGIRLMSLVATLSVTSRIP